MTQAVKSSRYTHHRVIHNTLVIDFKGTRRVLSSAPQGGGFTSACYVLNHQVEAIPDSSSQRRIHQSYYPARYLRRLAATLGLKGKTIGLMTAVPIKQLVKSRASSDGVWVECFATVGVTNAVRAGEWPPNHGRRKSAYAAGTINIVLITNVSFSNAAMVGAVQVATETKTGVLRDHDVPSWNGNRGATGTGTDAVVIVCSMRGQGLRNAYSGTHTIVGAMIGRAVADCMTRGLAKAKRWNKSHARLQR